LLVEIASSPSVPRNDPAKPLRRSPNPDRNGDTLTGRGIAYAQRSGAVVAIFAEVEIDRHSDKVWAKNSPWHTIAG